MLYFDSAVWESNSRTTHFTHNYSYFSVKLYVVLKIREQTILSTNFPIWYVFWADPIFTKIKRLFIFRKVIMDVTFDFFKFYFNGKQLIYNYNFTYKVSVITNNIQRNPKYYLIITNIIDCYCLNVVGWCSSSTGNSSNQRFRKGRVLRGCSFFYE